MISSRHKAAIGALFGEKTVLTSSPWEFVSLGSGGRDMRTGILLEPSAGVSPSVGESAGGVCPAASLVYVHERGESAPAFEGDRL